MMSTHKDHASSIILTASDRFRWVACQLDTLTHCLTRGKVRKALKDLPRDLHDTYARTLYAFNEGPYAEEAIKILRWLTYSEKLLTSTELLQVTGIFLDGNPHFEPDEALEDPRDIMRICSSLVSMASTANGDAESDYMSHKVSSDTANPGNTLGKPGTTKFVRLAHFSVKEYLVSRRVKVSSAAEHSLQAAESHDMLARSCIVYLLRFETEGPVCQDCCTNFPLARYVARSLGFHIRKGRAPSEQLQDLMMRLLKRGSPAFEAWVQLYDMDRSPRTEVRREFISILSPLHVACFEGMLEGV